MLLYVQNNVEDRKNKFEKEPLPVYQNNIKKALHETCLHNKDLLYLYIFVTNK